LKFDKCSICGEFRDCYTKTSFEKGSRPEQLFKYPIIYLCKECLKVIDKNGI